MSRAAFLLLLLMAAIALPMAGCSMLQDQVPPPVTAPPPAEADLWPGGRVPMCFQSPTAEDAWARGG